jgi:hypothetical protein
VRGTNLTNADARLTHLERAHAVEAAWLGGAKGVPAEVAQKQAQRKQRRQARRTKPNRTPDHA